MGPGTSFQSVLDDPIKPKSAEKVIFTCGRHYYTLLDERKKRNLVDKVALVRIEELCPFPTEFHVNNFGLHAYLADFHLVLVGLD